MQSKLRRRRAAGRLQARPDQPEQAAGDGRRLAAVRPGDRVDAVHLRRPDRLRPVHPPTGRVRDRLPARRGHRGAGHGDLGAGGHRAWSIGAVDVLDSRYQGFKFTLGDVVADNASAGAFYLGPIARPPDELELRLLGCVVRVDGEVVMTAAGAAVMGHPAASVAWLANQLAAAGREPEGRSADLLRWRDRAGSGGGRWQCDVRVRRPRRHRGVRRVAGPATDAAVSRPNWSGERGLHVAVDRSRHRPMPPRATASNCSRHLGHKVTVEPLPDQPAPAGRLLFAYGIGTVLPMPGELVLRATAADPNRWRTSRTCCSVIWRSSAPARNSS